jgi:metacaspase-1
MIQGMLNTKPAPIASQTPAAVVPSAAASTNAPGAKPSLARLAHLGTVLRAADGRVTVKLQGGNTIKLGEQIVFEVTSTVPGKLVLLDINAAGEMVQIFPNSFASLAQITRIPKDTAIPIPGPGYGFSGFKAVEPLGKGTLLAVVQPDSTSGSLALFAEHTTKGFQPVAAPNAYLEQLINHVTSGTKGSATADGWGFVRAEYEIVR